VGGSPQRVDEVSHGVRRHVAQQLRRVRAVAQLPLDLGPHLVLERGRVHVRAQAADQAAGGQRRRARLARARLGRAPFRL
jgi:ABC-type lipopolysaccharide export system ATPase subunit